ncbi:putative CrcB protein [Treponema primitia ZAS-2]|uniref:Fluoride-specific ion channel FluC n=2 Tax=Treponema primitia TaxID=88058 RepID=F5YHC5_TREPZ|nr:putative CrcB protein [Treponema primitia ZAS-2]
MLKKGAKMQYLSVLAGGAMGALLRYLSTQGISGLIKTPFPAGTLLVNMIGSLVIGFLFGVFETRAVPAGLRLFLITGFLGGYTTFSSYSLETVRLFLAGNISAAFINLALNNLLCLGFTFLGLGLSQKLVAHV